MSGLNEIQTIMDEELAENQPDFYYNGSVPADHDELDYVNISLKGVRLA